MSIGEKLEDLIKQATTERSHYYVAATAKEAAAEIARLRLALQTALEACRFYRDGADTYAINAAKHWHAEAQAASDLNP